MTDLDVRIAQIEAQSQLLTVLGTEAGMDAGDALFAGEDPQAVMAAYRREIDRLARAANALHAEIRAIRKAIENG